ncbi:hypothetical protein COLO4_37434 [Corchorus olitorius]|uniref:Uncharacterized protein n=1 Tax=Corchorus olitorius TaxID=93759 RepID=A0A1R3G1X9_9ROSI|nr:hypothetical protein COLO4_37434 [Corchorus olitorius]
MTRAWEAQIVETPPSDRPQSLGFCFAPFPLSICRLNFREGFREYGCYERG